MNKKIIISAECYPIIVITPKGAPNIEDIHHFTDELEEILESTTGGFIIISNNEKDVEIPVNIRVTLAKSLNYISGRYSSRELAVFVVLNSAFGRVMFSCLSLIAKNNNLTVVSSLEGAMEKARTVLEKTNYPKIEDAKRA